MAGLPPVIYFPYIDLEARPLWGLLVWFQKLLLLQPHFGSLGPCADQAQGLGWLSVERPLALNLDSRAAKALLSEWERLGRLYEDSGYLVYLQHGLPHLEEEPGWSIVREIRDYGTNAADRSPSEESLRGQLLLQMAQDLDRQRREIQEELAGLEDRQAEMLRHLGVQDGEPLEWAMEPLPTFEEDDFLIPQRIRAWAEILVARGQVDTPPLLTTNRLALEHLLERAMEGGGAPVALMQVRLPMFSPLDAHEAGRMRAALEDLLSWSIFCEKVAGLLQEVKGMSQVDLPTAMPRARALASYFHEELSEVLVERIISTEPRWGQGWQEANLQVVLFPGWDARALGRDPPSPGPGNLVIMHMEEVISAHR